MFIIKVILIRVISLFKVLQSLVLLVITFKIELAEFHVYIGCLNMVRAENFLAAKKGGLVKVDGVIHLFLLH